MAKTFTKRADFFGATFTQGANFGRTSFGPRGGEAVATSPAIADFRAVRFEQPAKVRFYRVNQDSVQESRMRVINANVENVQFVDVRWHYRGHRMVLQDELDITEPSGKFKECQKYHELAAIAYRQLVNNFEKVRDYDHAEDCWCGAMEMKRLDPAKFLFAKRLSRHYEKWAWLRWVGEQVSVTNLYRLASNYGSSYQRALAVLGGGLLVFGLLFSFVGLAQNVGKSVLWPEGLVHSLEVATLQSNTHSMATNGLAWAIELLERVFVPAQLSLFLLALRRRFRR